MKRQCPINRWMVIVITTISASGCSLFNPYIDTSDLGATPPEGSPPAVSGPCQYTSDSKPLDQAIKCADLLQSEYIDHMGDQAKLSAVSGVGLIALTAYTTGLAIDGDHTSQVSDFALGTAALYGMSQWLSQPERTQIYGLGAKAVNCAIEATVPFTAMESRVADFETEVKSLSTSAKSTRLNLGLVDQLIAENAALSNLPYAKAVANSSRELLTSADQAVLDAMGLIKTHKEAPYVLIATVRKINDSVNLGLKDTVQSLNSLPGALSNVLAMYSSSQQQFAAFSPDSGGEEDIAAQGNEETTENDNAVTALADSTQALAVQLAVVEPRIVMFRPALPADAIKSCGVNLDNINQPLSLNPASITFASDSATMLSVQASGGDGRYVSSHDADALDVKQPQPFGGTFQIAPKADAAGHYLVTIQDIGGKQAVLQVEVKAKSNGNNGGEALGNGQEAKPGIAACKPNDATDHREKLTVEACRERFTEAPKEFELSDAENELCTDAGEALNIQTLLKSKLPEGNPLRDLCHDGYYGPVTRQAILEFVEKAKGFDVEVTADDVTKIKNPDGGD